MVVVFVAVLFVCRGSMWLVEQQDGRDEACSPPQQLATSVVPWQAALRAGVSEKALCVPGGDDAKRPARQAAAAPPMFDASCLRLAPGVDLRDPLAAVQAASAGSATSRMFPMSSGAASSCGHDPFRRAMGGGKAIMVADSPVRPASSLDLLKASTVQITEHVEEPVAAPGLTVQELHRGLAAQLACRFSGDVDYHTKSLSAAIDVFGLRPWDLCYFFLCFEEVARSEGGADLKVRRHGTNTFTSRLWVATFARFVRAAQGDDRSRLDGLVEQLCAEWQYKLPNFMSEGRALEAVFQRKYGGKLLQAFQQESVRHVEVQRAHGVLKGLAATAAPIGARLVTTGEAEKTGALPAPAKPLQLQSGREASLMQPKLPPSLVLRSRVPAVAIEDVTPSAGVAGTSALAQRKKRQNSSQNGGKEDAKNSLPAAKRVRQRAR